jgi:flagellar basal body P-ring formation protein FlgA
MIRSAARNGALVAAAFVLALGVSAASGAQLVTLPVPTATIYPGSLIEAGQLSEHTFVQSQIGSGYVDTTIELVGKVARRTLLPDHPIPANAIDEVDLVTRGTSVQLVFQHAGLVITAYAAPLEDGSIGDLIRVRNIDSGAVVMGIVQPDGTVRVGPQ